MDLAFDVDQWDYNSPPSYLEAWASREFGSAVAQDTAQLMHNYSHAAGRRKYELVDPSTYSLINYNEADRILDEWNTMQTAAQTIMAKLPAETQPAFFEMIYHAVTSAYVFHDIMISAAKNNLYAEQGRNSVNMVAQHVRDQFAHDHNLSAQYNTMLDGKWAHMMDQVGYVYPVYPVVGSNNMSDTHRL